MARHRRVSRTRASKPPSKACSRFCIAGNFYSSSDSESEDEIERKIHVEIKPLNNGTAPISASVDELRATVENLSLSPIGALSVRKPFSRHCTTFSLPLPHSHSKLLSLGALCVAKNDNQSAFAHACVCYTIGLTRTLERHSGPTSFNNTADISFSNLFAYPYHEFFLFHFMRFLHFSAQNYQKKNHLQNILRQ
jgi:hypothetical protein